MRCAGQAPGDVGSMWSRGQEPVAVDNHSSSYLLDKRAEAVKSLVVRAVVGYLLGEADDWIRLGSTRRYRPHKWANEGFRGSRWRSEAWMPTVYWWAATALLLYMTATAISFCTVVFSKTRTMSNGKFSLRVLSRSMRACSLILSISD